MRTAVTGLALLIGSLTACGSPQGESRENLDYVDTVAQAEADAPQAPDGMGPPTAEDTAEGPPPAERSPDEGEAVHFTPDDDGALPDWRTTSLSVASTARRPPVRVTDLRAGRHPDFDRVVLDLGGDGGGIPGYSLEYVDRPIHECGSGRAIQPVGNGWLQVRLDPAAAHTEAGRALLGSQPRDPDLPGILRIYRTCDFEGVVELVLAVRSPEPFRAFHLDAPRRIVVDVRR